MVQASRIELRNRGWGPKLEVIIPEDWLRGLPEAPGKLRKPKLFKMVQNATFSKVPDAPVPLERCVAVSPGAGLSRPRACIGGVGACL